jgi:hypothetical protein
VSRSGYTDDYDNWALIRWRGAVKAAIRGKRGQAFLRELLAALDAMPEKRLIDQSFSAQGSYCALGTVFAARGVEQLDAEKLVFDYIPGMAAKALGIAPVLCAEIMYENDEQAGWIKETEEQRWARMRLWAESNLDRENAK